MKELKFDELGLKENIVKALNEAGYTETTEIQRKAIPLILEGEDIIGQSQTGTGKTASFGLPIVNSVDKEQNCVQAIVLCPTRELSLQVAQEMRKFTKYEEGVKILPVYGGQGIDKQIVELKRGTKVVIGTPGRVIDHIRRKTLKLQNIKMLVLDEADEMLSMGFEEDIETILKEIPEERQTVLFSATMNTRILNITKRYLKEPKNIKIKAKELTVENIEQTYMEVKEVSKKEVLSRILQVYNPKKCIIFSNTKRKVDEILEYLQGKDYKVDALHSDIKQIQRDRIMKNIKTGEIKILVATDVVARGIDVQDLELVINYDLPDDEEYYVHRIGRTGRNGTSGKAVSFVVGRQRNKLGYIEKYAKTEVKKVQIPSYEEVLEIKNKQIKKKIQKVMEREHFHKVDLIKEIIEENDGDATKVALALASMLYKDEKEVKIDVTADSNRRDRNGKREKSGKMSVASGNQKLFVNLGKRDDIRAKDIIGSITANALVSGSDIGKINVLDKFTFIEVPKSLIKDVLNGMDGKKIKGKEFNIEIANS